MIWGQFCIPQLILVWISISNSFKLGDRKFKIFLSEKEKCFMGSFEISWKQVNKIGSIFIKLELNEKYKWKLQFLWNKSPRISYLERVLAKISLKQVLKIKNSHLEITIIPFKNIIKFPLNTFILGKNITDFVFPDLNLYTGDPPLTWKLLTRFPLPRFFAYVRVSGGISISRGPQYSPTNSSFM